MNIKIEVLVLLLLACKVYTKTDQHETCTGEDVKDIHSDGSTCKFDACRYPTDDLVKETFLTVENKCNNNMTLLQEIRTITRDKMADIKRLLKEVTKTRHCHRQIQKLDKQHLEDIITVSTMPTTGSISEITNTYFDFAKQVNLIYLLESRIAPSVQDCCLTYPKEVGESLKNELLKKWFTQQNECGIAIDKTQCVVTLNVDLNGPIGCEKTADIIYLLLKSTQKGLENSTVVLGSQIRKIRSRTKRNRT